MAIRPVRAVRINLVGPLDLVDPEYGGVGLQDVDLDTGHLDTAIGADDGRRRALVDPGDIPDAPAIGILQEAMQALGIRAAIAVCALMPSGPGHGVGIAQEFDIPKLAVGQVGLVPRGQGEGSLLELLRAALAFMVVMAAAGRAKAR